jgi:arginine:pyruvate transaminase
MRYAGVTARLQELGGARWALHALARKMKAEGQPVIELTLGEPDVPVPEPLRAAAKAGIDADRFGYSNGRGEPGLLAALAARYSRRTGRAIWPENLIALPGTQTALYAVMQALLDPGDEVIVGDPMYATYAGVIAATGARLVPVALRPENGFRLDARDVAAVIGPRTRVLFLNTPHNPTGAVLRAQDLDELGALARAHDLWIVSDEVYEELVFPGAVFASPLARADLAGRVVVTSSISKSHAAPGFRSGWVVGPAEFCARLLPLAEAMLFGNQPFIADMTALAVAAPSPVAPEMAHRFARRAALIRRRLDGPLGLRVPMPEAGMFAMLDLRATGLTGEDFAARLLRDKLVAVMPGESFGAGLAGWVRVSLTKSDDLIEEACERILALAGEVKESAK